MGSDKSDRSGARPIWLKLTTFWSFEPDREQQLLHQPTLFRNHHLYSYFSCYSVLSFHSCQPSRFHRESPEIFSISRLPPGLHICNSISRDCYLSLHTCIDITPSFCKALVSACSKVQLEARHYNTSCERVHIIPYTETAGKIPKITTAETI